MYRRFPPSSALSCMTAWAVVAEPEKKSRIMSLLSVTCEINCLIKDTGLGKSKQAIFFSIFRKVVIVAPLTVILPIYMGIDGVFVAEAISNFIGGGACYITMLLTIGKELKQRAKAVKEV